jgi:hypothetical protein
MFPDNQENATHKGNKVKCFQIIWKSFTTEGTNSNNWKEKIFINYSGNIDMISF